MYANGQAVGVTRNSNYASSERSYFGTDLVGTVRSATTDSGSAEYHEYDFHLLRSRRRGTSSIISDSCSLINRPRKRTDVFGKPYGESISDYAYTGKPYDQTTGMYNYGYRDYVPQTARFSTIDPIRDGNNWFAYCNNEPVNFLDAWGLSASDVQNKDIYDMNKSDPSNTKCTQGDINKAINKIAESKWGKTVGKEVVEKLNEMNANGKINISDVSKTHKDADGYYSRRTGEITIDENLSGWDLERVLVHEGAHGVQDDNGQLAVYDFPDEREAYDATDDYMKSTHKMSINKSDDTIKQQYGFK